MHILEEETAATIDFFDIHMQIPKHMRTLNKEKKTKETKHHLGWEQCMFLFFVVNEFVDDDDNDNDNAPLVLASTTAFFSRLISADAACWSSLCSLCSPPWRVTHVSSG